MYHFQFLIFVKIFSIYNHFYIKLKGRPPIWRQWPRTDSCIWYVPLFSCTMSFVAPLVFFLRPVSCFRGRPPLVYDVPLCFCCLAQSSRVFFQRWVSSGHFPGRLFFAFLCLGPIFWFLGGLLCSFFASWIRKGAHLCQVAPPGHQLGGKWGHQVDFSPSPGVPFRTTFSYFFVFFRILRFCENWAPVRAGARFRGSRPLQMSLFLPWNPFQKSDRIWTLLPGGGGTPLEILSGLGGPPLVAKMLIGTGTGYGPKAQHLADVCEQSSEL